MVTFNFPYSSNAYLFKSTFTDGLQIEIRVNSEFENPKNAEEQAIKYATIIGRLPKILLHGFRHVEIHKGIDPYGYNKAVDEYTIRTMIAVGEYLNGSDSVTPFPLAMAIREVRTLVLHTYLWEYYEEKRKEQLGVVLLHEAAHLSIEKHHRDLSGDLSRDWKKAAQADGTFISEYAQSNNRPGKRPYSEDIVESFVAYFAIKYRKNRITEENYRKIQEAIPHRIELFDRQNYTGQLCPVVEEDCPSDSRERSLH